VALPLFGPPPPADRDAEIRGIAFKVLAASKRPQTLAQVMLSTAWVGLAPTATGEEVKAALHHLVGDGTVNRQTGDTAMWVYSLGKGG
jgi:hypothetical protein